MFQMKERCLIWDILKLVDSCRNFTLNINRKAVVDHLTQQALSLQFQKLSSQAFQTLQPRYLNLSLIWTHLLNLTDIKLSMFKEGLFLISSRCNQSCQEENWKCHLRGDTIRSIKVKISIDIRWSEMGWLMAISQVNSSESTETEINLIISQWI